MPGWVGPTAAISLVVIALAFAAIAAGSVMLARAAKKEISEFRIFLHVNDRPQLRLIREFAVGTGHFFID